jgi:Ring finger domain
MSYECPLCEEAYDTVIKIPRIHSCGRTYCQECLQKHVNATSRPPKLGECPNCRVVYTSAITELPRNLDLQSPPPAARNVGLQSQFADTSPTALLVRQFEDLGFPEAARKLVVEATSLVLIHKIGHSTPFATVWKGKMGDSMVRSHVIRMHTCNSTG